jgi:thioredoxin-related protein
MKYTHLVSTFLFSFLVLSVTAQKRPPSVGEVMKLAYQQAAKEGKNVFVITHASWCSWCRKMDTAMSDPEVKDFFDKNYVIAHITAYESKGKEALENEGAVAFLTKHGGNDQGLPFWFVFDANGKLLSHSKMKVAGKKDLQNVGCPASDAEVAHFIQVLKKTSSLGEEALGKIAKRFRLNEQ